MSGRTPYLPGWVEPARRMRAKRPVQRRLRRVTVTMPEDVWRWVQTIAWRRRVSRSRALSEVLRDRRIRSNPVGSWILDIWRAFTRGGL